MSDNQDGPFYEYESNRVEVNLTRKSHAELMNTNIDGIKCIWTCFTDYSIDEKPERFLNFAWRFEWDELKKQGIVGFKGDIGVEVMAEETPQRRPALVPAPAYPGACGPFCSRRTYTQVQHPYPNYPPGVYGGQQQVPMSAFVPRPTYCSAGFVNCPVPPAPAAPAVPAVPDRSHWPLYEQNFEVEFTASGQVFEQRAVAMRDVQRARRMSFYYMLNPIYAKDDHLVDHLVAANFEATDYTDAVMVLEGDKKIHVSKALLSHHSDFFRALFFFKPEGVHEEIQVGDVPYIDFVRFLSMIHKKQYFPTDGTAETILKLATRFQVDSIRDRIEKFLRGGSEACASRLLFLADQYGMEELYHDVFLSMNSQQQVAEIRKGRYYHLLSNRTRMKLMDTMCSFVSETD